MVLDRIADLVGVDPLIVAALLGAVGLVVLFLLVARLRGPSAEARESQRAHEEAQERAPPVDVGETYTFGVKELSEHHSGTQVAVGEVEGFVLFVEDIPGSVGPGDVIRAKVLSFNEGRTSADATFVEKA
ncbi:TRAM domain-containing protein [Haloparvum sp. PAK95]|uniref:TRAM domain-containing protein n=1 Tax=Haloparvum sp. PAK95 TaxID=3418962 RepID=UPI003D2F40B2